jgi:hypothetical protein
MKKDSEFQKFDKTMTQLLKVPHSEIKEKLDKEKADKGKKDKDGKQKTVRL